MTTSQLVKKSKFFTVSVTMISLIASNLGGFLYLVPNAKAANVLAVSTNLDGSTKVNPTNGFPMYYADSTGLRLQPCLGTNLDGSGPADPNCVLLADDGYDPAADISFPSNFPGEFFYYIADANVGDASFRMALEGTFGNAAGAPVAGEQITFMRVRLQQMNGLAPNSTYEVTYPFGTFSFSTDANGDAISNAGGGSSFLAEDGPGAVGDFEILLPVTETNVQKFLAATSGITPNGYIGNNGSQTIEAGTNSGALTITGPNIDPTNADGLGDVNSLTTAQWSVAGKIATPVLSSINITPVTPSVQAGTAQQFSAAAFDQFADPIATTVTWSSDNAAAGSIDPASGLFTAAVDATPGSTTTITATSGAVSATTTVTITAAPSVLSSIIIAPANSSMPYGQTRQFTTIQLDQFGNPMVTPSVVNWSSSNTAVGDINPATGLFSAIASGDAVITAISGSVSATTNINVHAPAVSTLQISKNADGTTKVDPVNGFPVWYGDSSGTRVQPCLGTGANGNGPADPRCVLLGDAGYNPAADIDFPTNFPSEFFYYIADANIGNADFRMALEGTFTGAPANGTQLTFIRVRLQQLSGLTPLSTYTVTYPFGTFTFDTDAAGVANGGGVSYLAEDGPGGPGTFTVLLPATETNVNKFLAAVAPASAAGYLGNNGSQTIEAGASGSLFKIEGPNVGGNGVHVISTDQWKIAGKILANTAPTIGAIADQPALQGVLSTFTATATDAEGDAITYSMTPVTAIGNEASAVINPTTGAFSWTPSTVGTSTFTITASDGSLTTSTNVNVVVSAGPVLTTLTMTPATLAMIIGDAPQALLVEGFDQFSAPIAIAGTTFASDNSAVASVDPVAGIVTAATPGTATITATNGTKTASSVITVSNPAAVTAVIDQIAALPPFVTLADEAAVVAARAAFDALPIEQQVLVTNIANLATAEAQIATLKIPVLTSISVTPLTATVVAGTTTQISASALDQFAVPMATQPAVIWTSSDPLVATVDAAGLVTGITTGTVNITATSGLVTSNFSVITVTPAPSNIDALTAAISSAQAVYDGAVVGTLPGEYAAADKATLLSAIDAAKLITTATPQADVDAAVTTLNSAVIAFQATVIVAPVANIDVLTAAISSAQAVYDGAVVGTLPGEYAAADKATLLSAIDAAKLITTATPQADVDAAVIALNNAVTAFQATVIVAQNQTAPTETLIGVAPTVAGNDGQITGTTTAMEYKLVTDINYAPATATAITGLAAGNYNVRYAATPGFNAGADVIVTVPAYVAPAPVLASMTIAPATMPLFIVGTFRQLIIVNAVDQNGAAMATTPAVTWTSSDDAVATVSPSGLVSALKAGPFTITATSTQVPTVVATISSSVIPPAAVSSVKVAPQAISLAVGITTQLSGIPVDGLGAPIVPTPAVSWKSSNTAVATVNNKGEIKGIKVGTATITATSGTMTGTTTVNVIARNATSTLNSIRVTPGNLKVRANKTQQFTATALDQNGITLKTKPVISWSSSNPAVGTINASGVFSALAAGSSIIKATNTASGVSGETLVTVNANPGAGYVLSEIILDPETVAINQDDQQQFYATEVDQEGVATGEELAGGAWSSSNSAVGTIDSNGLFTAVAPGTADITVSGEGVSQTTTITVAADFAAEELANAKDEAAVELAKVVDAKTAYTSAGGSANDAVYVDVETAADELTEAVASDITAEILSATAALTNKIDALTNATDALEAAAAQLASAKTAAAAELAKVADALTAYVAADGLTSDAVYTDVTAAKDAVDAAVASNITADILSTTAALTTKLGALAAATTALENAAAQDDIDKAAAKTVSDLIAALPPTITLDDKVAVEAARTAFDALTAAQELLVANQTILTAAEAQIAALQNAALDDQAAADAVIAKIDALPSAITLADASAVKSARNAFNALTAAQELLVTNLAVLTTAETKIASLQSAADAAAAQAAADAAAQAAADEQARIQAEKEKTESERIESERIESERVERERIESEQAAAKKIADKKKEEKKKEEKRKEEKKKKEAKKRAEKKVAEFKVFATPEHQAAYRTVSSLKKTNPAKFAAMEKAFKQYNTVGGKLKVKPSAGTMSAINMFRSYEAYSIYQHHASKLKNKK